MRHFISSVQKELAAVRRTAKDFITRDSLLNRFVSDVFLFEDIPAGDRNPDDIYTNAAMLLFGKSPADSSTMRKSIASISMALKNKSLSHRNSPKREDGLK